MKKKLLFLASDFLDWFGDRLDAAAMFVTEAGWKVSQLAYQANPKGWKDINDGSRR